jgi:Cu-Zn family superoxide dismutase
MLRIFAMVMLLLTSVTLNAAELTANMYAMNQPSASHGSTKISLGTIDAKDTRYGLLLMPELEGLPHGMHGFHLHIFPSCENEGLAAGGHYDPKVTRKHAGPYSDDGHLGDLPMLYVNKEGVARVPELAPRLSVAQLRGHSLLIELGKYNNKTHEEAKGEVIACGVVT